MNSTTLAIPTEERGDTAHISEHFGHCTHFTFCKLVDGKLAETRKVPNNPHQSGGCLSVVNLLAANGANAVLAKGMGMRPLAGLKQAGITPYYAQNCQSVDEAVQAFSNNVLQPFAENFTCGGGGAHH